MGKILESWDSGILGFLVSPQISGSQVFSFTRRRHTSDAGSPESECGPWRGVRKVSVQQIPLKNSVLESIESELGLITGSFSLLVATIGAR
jgi:hypothetical protein